MMMRQSVSLWLLAALLLPARAAYGDDPVKPSPSVRAVVQMALKVARHTAPGRADELGKRARLAGLVPQLRLGARRGLQQDLSSTSTTSDDRTNSSLGADLTLEAGLTFQLDRLVFAPEQVRLLAVERWLAADRRKLIEDVVHLYFRRVRLVQERASAAQPDPAVEADIAELEALLDAYTEGEFSAALAKLEPPAAVASTQTQQAAASVPRPAPPTPSVTPSDSAASGSSSRARESP